MQCAVLSDPTLGDAPIDVILGADTIVVELPRSYPGSRVNPGDLITLAYRAGQVVGRCRGAFTKVRTLFPADWKGQTPKRVMNQRVLARLDEAERAAVAMMDHNVLDAVGIGLWHLGRL